MAGQLAQTDKNVAEFWTPRSTLPDLHLAALFLGSAYEVSLELFLARIGSCFG